MVRALLFVTFTLCCMLAPATFRSPVALGATTAVVGQPAPSFVVATLDGGSVSSRFDGEPVYINVFASWCPPCRSEMPSILAQSKEYAGRILFLFVDEKEAPSRVKAFAQTAGLDRPIAIDAGQFAAAYGIGGLPESIFIDRSGIVRLVYRGLIPQPLLAATLSQLASSGTPSH